MVNIGNRLLGTEAYSLLTSKVAESERKPEKFGKGAESLQQLTQKVASLPDEFGN